MEDVRDEQSTMGCSRCEKMTDKLVRLAPQDRARTFPLSQTDGYR